MEKQAGKWHLARDCKGNPCNQSAEHVLKAKKARKSVDVQSPTEKKKTTETPDKFLVGKEKHTAC